MFRYASDQSLYLDLPPETVNLNGLLQIPGVVNIHPAYTSILIVFDPLRTTHDTVQQAAVITAAAHQPVRHHQIPVTYNGPDLAAVAQFHNLTPEKVVELHTTANYKVAFLGFVPGFAYLTGLPEALRTPRLPSPRKEVPAGSVGIAGEQTGIYPRSTPGGWQLIGHTAIELFNVANSPMSVLQPGDLVRFFPV